MQISKWMSCIIQRTLLQTAFVRVCSVLGQIGIQGQDPPLWVCGHRPRVATRYPVTGPTGRTVVSVCWVLRDVHRCSSCFYAVPWCHPLTHSWPTVWNSLTWCVPCTWLFHISSAGILHSPFSGFFGVFSVVFLSLRTWLFTGLCVHLFTVRTHSDCLSP